MLVNKRQEAVTELFDEVHKVCADIIAEGGANVYDDVADVMDKAETMAQKMFTGADAITNYEAEPVVKHEPIVKHVAPAAPKELPKEVPAICKSAGDRLVARAMALRAHRGNISMADAIQEVRNKNVELSKAYTHERTLKAMPTVPVTEGQDAQVPGGVWRPNGSTPREDIGSWDDPSRSQLEALFQSLKTKFPTMTQVDVARAIEMWVPLGKAAAPNMGVHQRFAARVAAVMRTHSGVTLEEARDHVARSSPDLAAACGAK